MNQKSKEELTEDKVKRLLDKEGIKYYTKNASINFDIDNALKLGLSKSGGKGGNYPDIKLLINDLPIMIEVKGNFDDMWSFKKLYELDMNNKTIPKYALNGAVHYSSLIVCSSKYDTCLAVGIVPNLIDFCYSYALVKRDEKTKIYQETKNNFIFSHNIMYNINKNNVESFINK